MCTMCMPDTLGGQKRVSDPAGTGLTNSCELLRGSLLEQPEVPLTTEPQILYCKFKFYLLFLCSDVHINTGTCIYEGQRKTFKNWFSSFCLESGNQSS